MTDASELPEYAIFMPLMCPFPVLPLPPFSERLANVTRVAAIVKHLHSLPSAVLHGDIKPANIVVRPARRGRGDAVSPQLLLADFGSAVLKRTESATPSSVTAGSVAYDKVGTLFPRKLDSFFLSLSHLLTFCRCIMTTCTASPRPRGRSCAGLRRPKMASFQTYACFRISSTRGLWKRSWALGCVQANCTPINNFHVPKPVVPVAAQASFHYSRYMS